MNPDLKTRFVAPAAVIVLSFVAVESVALLASRVLLASSKTMAAAVALAAAVAIMLGAWLLSAKPRFKSSSIWLLGIVGLAAIVGLGAISWDRASQPSEHGSGGEAMAVEVVTKDVAFSAQTIDLKAHSSVELELINEDLVAHNLAIFEDETLVKEIFRGEFVNPGETATYEFDAPDAGEYYFHCDIHPEMMGSVTVT